MLLALVVPVASAPEVAARAQVGLAPALLVARALVSQVVQGRVVQHQASAAAARAARALPVVQARVAPQ